MQSLDDEIRKENIRMCTSLGLYHMLDRGDLENELRRLEEKNQLLLQYVESCTAITSEKIKKIKTVLDAK